MNEAQIRKRYQREDKQDLRGTNAGAIDRFIEMLRLHEKNDDKRIRKIANSFYMVDKIVPNFTIFQAEKCLFMHNFKAFQVSEDTDMLVVTHEFGHAILSMINDTVVPENYREIIERAKEYAISPQNKEEFKKYVQFICGKTDKRDSRTDAEKGPVSDIISSIFQVQALRINTYDNICVFPSSHERSYYYDEEKKMPKIKKVFDEDFANYYSLKVNNCTQEIEIVRMLFGDELVQVLDSELEKIYERLLMLQRNEPISQPEEKSLGDLVDITVLEDTTYIKAVEGLLAREQRTKSRKIKNCNNIDGGK